MTSSAARLANGLANGLAINPAVAGEIVLAEKPAITTDSDRMDRGALDQLLLHTGTLGSIYHKNPEVRPTAR